MSNEVIYERNVHDLQEQLQHAYTHIDELNRIKTAAQAVINAQRNLNNLADFNNKLIIDLNDAIVNLNDVIDRLD